MIRQIRQFFPPPIFSHVRYRENSILLAATWYQFFLPVVLIIIKLIMIIFQPNWPQLDISPYSYQSYSVIALMLLCLAVPFLQPQAV